MSIADNIKKIRIQYDLTQAELGEIAGKHGEAIAKALGTEYSKEMTVNYLRKMAEGRAETINSETVSFLIMFMYFSYPAPLS